MKVIVCGAGQVGSTIARHLATEGIDVTVIDIDPKQVRLIDESYDVRGVLGHASYPSILEKAGAHDADMLIAVTRSDEVNMVACQMAYTLFGVKRRVARLRHTGYLAQGETGLYAAEHMPIDVIISPEIEIAESIAHRLKTPGAFDMLPLADGKVALLGIHADANNCDAVGQTFSSLSGGGTGEGMSVLAVLREGRCFIPRGEDVLELGDDVYIIAHTGGVDHVMAAFGHRETEARRVIIVGGGNVGLHLAQRLRRDTPDVDIKIIELSPGRAEYVAQQMGGRVVVLQGDALDRDMLKEAQVASTETVVAVTDDDETNIFASVLAKRAGCERAITLINKRSYEALLPTLGIDAAVSPSAVTISTVLRHVRHGAISALYTLREDFGEVIEAELSSTSPLLRGRLTDLDLPSGMKIGAVMRNGSVLIAGGDTQLEAGDRVIALVTYQHLRAAAGLLGGKPTAA